MKNYAIETKGLTKQYGEHLGVNHLDLHVEYGKIYGLLGRNGAGKTTTMRMLLNLIHPTSGEIYLFGEPYKKCPHITYKKIGSLIETPGFYENLTGRENLQILARLRGQHRKDSVEHALEVVGLAGEVKKRYGNYSLGMKQRLGIAAAIMHEPELLILDEPINGLDPIGIHEIRKYLQVLAREKGTTILISSHVLSEIEQLADVIGVMHEGSLIEEAEMSELHKRNRKYVEFQVSNENATCVLLEKVFGTKDYKVYEDHIIRVFTHIEQRGQMNQCFIENGIVVTRVNVSEESLEDYFAKLIGGGQIG